MGDRFENQQAAALSKLIREYPLSAHVDGAKDMLTALKRPVPEADPAAYARMKYEMENRTRPGIIHRTISPFESHPDTFLSAKSGAPAMESIRPAIPVSVPATAAGGQSGVSDVSATQVVGNTEAIDKTPDARLGVQPAAAGANNPAATTGVGAPAANSPTSNTPAANTISGTGEQKASLGSNGQSVTPAAGITTTAAAEPALPTNHPPTKDQLKAYKKAQEKAAKQAKKPAAAKPAAPATDAGCRRTTPALPLRRRNRRPPRNEPDSARRR